MVRLGAKLFKNANDASNNFCSLLPEGVTGAVVWYHGR